jgi:two-component system chemotaxis response regulator CheB
MPQYPLPVVMVSALTQKGKRITIEALEAGAVDVVQKPSANVAQSLSDMMMELRTKVKIASTANVSHWKTRRPDEKPHIIGMTKSLAESTDKVVAIGASTGGTEAIRRVIERFPAIAPGIVIVQHMPAGFTRAFAERLNMLCLMEVKEAESGDRIMPGRILIAPGDYHLTVRRSGAFYSVECLAGEKVNGHCPSVDVLMLSVAEHVGANAVGVMLTGMGHDGAEGMLEMRRAGARTIAQDEQSCIVFGMPKCAYDRGGAESLVPLDKIAQTVLSYI